MSPAQPTTAPAPPAADADIEAASTLNDVLGKRAARSPEATYLTYLADGDRDERTLSFGELELRSRAVAAVLSGRGLAAGDRVMIMLDSGLDFVGSFFGVLAAGMVPVPVYPPARLTRLEHYLRTLSGILETADVRGAIADQRLIPLVGPRLPDTLILVSDRELAAGRDRPAIELPELHPLLPSSAGFLQFTSGTTQSPRGVLLLQEQIMEQLRAYGTSLGITPGEVAVSWLPLYHDLGLIGKLLASLHRGIHLVLMSPVHFLKEPMRWIRALHHYRGVHTAAPNFAFDLCVRKCPHELLEREEIDLGSVDNMGMGGEVVSFATVERFREHFAPFGFRGAVLNPSYGLAENTLVVSTHRRGEALRTVTVGRDALARNEVAEPTDAADAFTIPGNGAPMEGTSVRILAADGAVLPERRIGEVCVQSPCLAAGYFQDGEATASTFPIGDDGRWLRTGDLGFLAAGDLYICGRSKDLMIVRGRNYHPQDIEGIASRVEGVRAGNVAAFSVEDGDGERPVLVCELDDRTRRPTAELRAELIEAIGGTFGLGLDEVVFVAKGALPKTSSGKLQRGLVKNGYLDGSLAAFTPPGRLATWGLGLRIGLRRLLGGGRPRGGGAAASSSASASAAEALDDGGVEHLDPRIVEALARARSEHGLQPSPKLRVDALGLGSMELMELWLAVERLYDARVPDEEWAATQTLGAVQRLVERFEGTAGGEAREGSDRDGEAAMPLFVRQLLEDEAARGESTTAIVPWRRPITAPIAFGFVRMCSAIFWGQRSSGVEHVIDDGGSILAGNHVSYLDPAWVRSCLPRDARRRLIAMAWEGAPASTRWFMGQVETIPIDPLGNFRGAMQAGLTALRQDRTLLIFPEGSRSHTGQLLTFRPGIGLLSLLSGRPIVPFRIVGGFEIYPRDRGFPRFFRWRKRRGDRLEIRFGAPIVPPPHDPAATWDQARAIVAEVRRAVEGL